MLTFPSALNHGRHPPQGLGELQKSTFFFGGKNSTNWLFSNTPRTLPVHEVIHISRSYFLSGIFFFDISEWHILPARAWTPALMLHLTNPCTKRKVLSLAKLKGKIYKTKSIGHYITYIHIYICVCMCVCVCACVCVCVCEYPWVNSRADCALFKLSMGTDLGERKALNSSLLNSAKKLTSYHFILVRRNLYIYIYIKHILFCVYCWNVVIGRF